MANWKIVEALCETNDHWVFKDFILVMFFYRFLSEDFTQYINMGEIEAGVSDFDYAALSDDDADSAREEMAETKGYFLLPSQLFCNVLMTAPTNENLNETLETIFRSIEESSIGHSSEAGFRGLFDKFDVNSSELGKSVSERNERLVRLMNGIAALEVAIDNYGNLFEELIGMFASETGKKGGKFFTPSHISELLVRLVISEETDMPKIYDPACGSGSLLLKSIQILGKDHIRGFYGQDVENTVYNLCRMNMFLHGIDYDRFDIEREDTLEKPQHEDLHPFDIIVSNPQFDITWSGKNDPLLINDPRFSPAGILAPNSRPYLAFVMHSLAWLSADGTAALICEPGSLYRTNSKAEPQIRQYLVDNNYIDCIIQLGANLFYRDKGKGKGGTIAVCVIVLRKNKTQNSTLFIDASLECEKVKNGNTLTDDNISKIISAFNERIDHPGFCRLVPNSEIAENAYNLSVSGYVTQTIEREVIDIVKLNAETSQIIERVNSLNEEIDRIIAEIEGEKT